MKMLRICFFNYAENTLESRSGKGERGLLRSTFWGLHLSFGMSFIFCLPAFA